MYVKSFRFEYTVDCRKVCSICYFNVLLILQYNIKYTINTTIMFMVNFYKTIRGGDKDYLHPSSSPIDFSTRPAWMIIVLPFVCSTTTLSNIAPPKNHASKRHRRRSIHRSGDWPTVASTSSVNHYSCTEFSAQDIYFLPNSQCRLFICTMV
jgi:hypothetical protein